MTFVYDVSTVLYGLLYDDTIYDFKLLFFCCSLTREKHKSSSTHILDIYIYIYIYIFLPFWIHVYLPNILRCYIIIKGSGERIIRWILPDYEVHRYTHDQNENIKTSNMI